jgi:transcriptional regulator with XRE-family HTH domain
MKRKIKSSSAELPELCRAVRAIREAAGWSQEKMAQETGIATQTISRFELGKQEPRNLVVLIRLREVAEQTGLDSEIKLFSDALAKAPKLTWHHYTGIEAALSQIRTYQNHPPIRQEYRKVLRALLRAHHVLAGQIVLGIQGKSNFYGDLMRNARAQGDLRKELAKLEKTNDQASN